MNVRSSLIKSVEADGNDLIISFVRGGVWKYTGAGSMFPAIVSAPSVGKFFLSNIKGRFKEEKLS
jgi:hypothetical protein